ncbi:MAG: hypothetical protein DBX47_07510 [Clostridiales bacterium]|nr:MAG: hypothetical protein DBX47_07510 [Clostridiales bacterium]
MKIKSETVFTEKTFKDIAFFRFCYGKKGIATAIFAIYFLALIAAGISMVQLKDVISSGFFMLLLALGIYFYLFLITLPKLEYSYEKRTEHLCYEYTFCDSDFIIKTGSDYYTSLESMRYDGLLRVTEYDMYFILNVTPKRFYVVEKSGMSVENVKQLREKFLSEISPKQVYVNID